MTPESELYICMHSNYDGTLCNRVHLRHCRDVARRLNHAITKWIHSWTVLALMSFTRTIHHFPLTALPLYVAIILPLCRQ